MIRRRRPAALLGLPLVESAMRLRRPTYAEQQALAFIAAAALIGSAAGLLYGLLHP